MTLPARVPSHLKFFIEADGSWRPEGAAHGLSGDDLADVLRTFVGLRPRFVADLATTPGIAAKIRKLQALADDHRAPDGERSAARAAIERLRASA